METDTSAAAAAVRAENDVAYQDLWASTVASLTAAAGTKHEKFGQLDFAGFLASALAAVAANVGGVDQVLAGRSGSWEADLVESLINGTVGVDDQAALLAHRTVPVVVPLNVGTLMEDAFAVGGSEGPYRDELAALEARQEAAYQSRVDADPDLDWDYTADEQETAAATARWAARYARYAEDFTVAVEAEAATIKGLTVPVTVVAITDPEASWEGPDHPSDWDGDPVAWQLWSAARDRVPLPTGEVQPVIERKINDPAEATTENEYVDKLAEAGLIVDDRPEATS